MLVKLKYVFLVNGVKNNKELCQAIFLAEVMSPTLDLGSLYRRALWSMLTLATFTLQLATFIFISQLLLSTFILYLATFARIIC